MATTIPFGTITALSGLRTVGPAAVPDNVSVITLAMTRNTGSPTVDAQPALHIDVTWEMSINGGDFFQHGAFSTVGGQVLHRGVPETTSTMTLVLPAGINRQGRLTVNVSGGTLNTDLSATVA